MCFAYFLKNSINKGVKFMNAKKIYLRIISILLGFIAIFGVVGLNARANTYSSEYIDNQEIRTISYNNKTIIEDNMFEKFDEHEITEYGSNLNIVAKKNFDMSILEEIDLIGLDESEDTFTVRYDIDYMPDDSTVLLSINIEGIDDIPIVDTIPGLITINSKGEKDVMFAYEGEYFWLSDLVEDNVLDNTGLFSWLKKAVKSVVNGAIKAIQSFCKNGLELIHDIITLNVSKLLADLGAIALNMTEEVDSNGKHLGIYHADFDCWQEAFGYNDFYDIVFDTFTVMDRRKFEYDIDEEPGNDHILWVWKGDYLNLGAGAELGVYKRWDYDSNFWVVDKNEAMTMTLTLYKGSVKLFDYKPTEQQWWITGFNYKYHVKQSELSSLKATYTVTFNNEETSEAFNKANKEYSYNWSGGSGYTYTYSF